jgi:Fuc2NAc and GlcNAc transferase
LQSGSNLLELAASMPAMALLSIIALTISWISCLVLLRHGHDRLLDVPVARSAHQHATPRGGGLAIALAVLLAVFLIGITGVLPWPAVAVLCCAFPIAVIGLLDDIYTLPVRYRLPVHLLCAGAALLLLGPVPEPFLSGWLNLPGWSKSLLLMVALVWLLNLYNFMDGVDALAAAQCLFVSAAGAYFLWQSRDPVMWVCAGLFGATAGFLLWNLPPARIFMGDVGSTFLGFFMGLTGLLTHYSGALSVWVWVLLMGTFIADTTFTLLRRLISGQSVTQGHNSHAYQRLARRSGSHRSVIVLYSAVNIFWCLPFAWLAIVYPHLGVVLAFSGIVPLMLVAAFIGAGYKDAT